MGVVITSTDIYNLLLKVDKRVSAIEAKFEAQEEDRISIKEDSARIRILQAQVAAMWVVHTIMLAAITANYVKGM